MLIALWKFSKVMMSRVNVSSVVWCSSINFILAYKCLGAGRRQYCRYTKSPWAITLFKEIWEVKFSLERGDSQISFKRVVTQVEDLVYRKYCLLTAPKHLFKNIIISISLVLRGPDTISFYKFYCTHLLNINSMSLSSLPNNDTAIQYFLFFGWVSESWWFWTGDSSHIRK